MTKVLIVEDDPGWVAVFEVYCRQESLNPIAVSSPQAALDAIDIYSPKIIVLDMLLATETGMALLNEMRGYEDLTDIKIIVCTNVSEINEENLKPFGVDYLFDKSSLDPSSIRFALRRLADE